MARILSIDYGQKRTGIAVSDPLRLTANGLETVPTHRLIAYLQEYTAREQVDTFVLGFPSQPDGSPSSNQERVRQIATALQRRFPNIRLVLYDERFTSVLAHRAMIDGGLHRKARQDKALVDKISATILLQDYMEHLRLNPQ
ncbi:MAG: Holliday junction resolvase RuvX [Paludibacteraceae bacterium]|nr:Holliday junction resolvase RuvX [Paludibacteraceae bacterium]